MDNNEFDYQKRADIKFILDILFLIIILVMILFVSIKQIWNITTISVVSFLFIAYIGQYIWSREWILKALSNDIKNKEKKTSDSASKILDLTINQKNEISKYEHSFLETANSVEKLKSLSFALKQNSRSSTIL